MTTALVFPGQGSQAVGMGKALAEAFPAAREVFEQVDAALGESLSKLIFEGPEAELTLTANAQPALMATSLAALRALESEAGLDVARDAAFVAGHSLGEYSALCAAGALTLEDTARLLRIRGAAMQQAVPVGEGAMAAILGLEFDAVTAIAAEAAKRRRRLRGRQRQRRRPGGDLRREGGGRAGDGDRQSQGRQARAAAAGVGAVPLRADAAGGRRDGGGAGDDDDSQRRRFRWSPMSAPAPLSDPEAIRASLVAQVTGAVRWRESVQFMAAQGVDRFVEIGAGKVLAGLVKRIADERERGQASGRRPTSKPIRRRAPSEGAPNEERPRLCSISRERRRSSPAPRAASAARSRARCTRQGATVALSGTRARRWRRSPANSARALMSLPCDLADAAAVEALVPAAEAAMGSLDILVNNAGVTRDNLFMRMKDAEWDTVIAVDLTAAFRLSRACLRGMMRRRFGRIIGITSIVGVTGNPGQGNYAAAKAGMIGMSKALAAEVASRGITVNCIAPGFIASPMTDALNDKQREAILASVPMGRLGAGADIGAAAVYLASDEAAYVTGQTLHVNGGMAMI